ncbi:hypothetical protein EV180_005411, partial [Coemansia sp. RSA 518]
SISAAVTSLCQCGCRKFQTNRSARLFYGRQLSQTICPARMNWHLLMPLKPRFMSARSATSAKRS